MVRYLRSICMMFFLICTGYSVSVFAQGIEFSSQKGLEYFKGGNYKDAEVVYAHLFEKYPKDARYNFYLGICEVKNRSNVSGAIKKLNYARIKNVSRDVYYYLGRAHQLSYHFDEAISNFKKFMSNVSSGDNRVKKAKKYILECNNAKKISSKIYNLSVLDKSVVRKESMLEMYYPAKDVGKLFKNSDFFESGVNPNNVMFETERGDVVYFSMGVNNEDTLSIFKMVKLLDGWGDSESLDEPVNSVYNDAYPFLETDGLTLYFSSDRPGGLGGFDIYRAYYDNETRSFLNPINMGVPFNSPDDDFLFVSDEFSKIAWFASNRETSGDSVMVYTIRWDGNQVRNMAEDAQQIQESALLRVQGGNRVEEGGDEGFVYAKKIQQQKKKGAFKFEINDTLVYTDFDHFISKEALNLFKEGYLFEQKKDSLSVLMGIKRKDYSHAANAQEQNDLVNEILKLENKVYGLEDLIQEKYLYARKKELDEILLRINNGTYHTSQQVNSNTAHPVSIEGIFIPEKYAFHTSDEFERYFSKQKVMYRQLFSENDIKTLRYSDSLYVWAGILNLESSRLLEGSTKVQEGGDGLNISQLIRKSDSLNDSNEALTSKEMMKESKELKILSTRIYHKALDIKFPVYWLKLKDVSSKMSAEEGKQIMELSQQGNAYVREAKRTLSSSLGGLSIEEYEKAGAMKRAGVESQEDALNMYVDMLENGYKVSDDEVVKKKTGGVIQKSYSELQGGLVSENIGENRAEEEVVNSNSGSKSEEKSVPVKDASTEFKVQIGVFRNPPKSSALSKIPEVTSIELKGRGLTKYFAGHYQSYEAASEAIMQIVEAGFPGAFVVYFVDGKISSVPKE